MDQVVVLKNECIWSAFGSRNTKNKYEAEKMEMLIT